MSHVYISYAHDDREFANSLKGDLDAAGFETLLDIDRLVRAEFWQEVTDLHIRQASAVITILSPAASLSACCNYEWAFALGLRIPVIPILLKRTPVHLRLETVQRWDFTNPAVRPIDKLVDQVKRIQSASAPTHEAEPERGILPLLDDLYSEDRDLRLAAVIALGNQSNSQVVPHLLGALGEDDREIRL
ncbi:MAG: toll/interleukin-1 receptor domain-containing protein, partial [Anaerolineae bacterium]|nr:toll/interleukin-1 receptor domain-containing protein [Anaerolineae bacterium]